MLPLHRLENLLEALDSMIGFLRRRRRTADYPSLPPLPSPEEENTYRKLSQTDAFQVFSRDELKRQAGKPLSATELYWIRRFMRFFYRARIIWVFVVGTFAAVLALATTAISILEYFNLHWH